MSWSSQWAAGGCDTGFRVAAKTGKLHRGQVKVGCGEKKGCEARCGRQVKVACRSLQRGSGSNGNRRRVNGVAESSPPDLVLESDVLIDQDTLFDGNGLNGSSNGNSKTIINGNSAERAGHHINGHTATFPNGHQTGNGVNGSEFTINGSGNNALSSNGINHHNGSTGLHRQSNFQDNNGTVMINGKEIVPSGQHFIPMSIKREPGDGALFAVEMHVRDYELDQFGVVNHSVFINYLDHARHEFLVEVGLDPDEVAQSGKALAIVRQELKYSAPLKSRDKFRCTIYVRKMTKARCIWTEEIWKMSEEPGKNDQLVASAKTEGICLDSKYRPIRVPEQVRANLHKFQEGRDICVRR